MGLFDKVRQVLVRAGGAIPGQGKGSDARAGGAGSDGASAAASGAQARRAQEEALPGADSPHAVDTARPAAVQTPSDPAKPQAAQRHRTHTVQPDQPLSEIAQRHGVSVADLAELNGIDPDLIFAGQVLRIPHP